MKSRFLSLFLFCVSIHSFAQNLVVNGSFEEYTICPTTTGQMNNCVDWKASLATPDYVTACMFVNTWPCNMFSTSACLPAVNNGSAYCSLISYNAQNSSVREHIRGVLVTPLVTGTTYYVSFKIALSSSAIAATNKFGAVFTNISYEYPGNPSPILNYAHVYTDSIIADEYNWHTVKGTFVPDTAYQFIMLGNFFDNDSVELLQLAPPQIPSQSIYLLDDVCVSSDSITCGFIPSNTDTSPPPPIDTPVVSPPDTPSIPPLIDTTHHDTTTVTPIDTFTMPSAFTPNGDNVNDVFQPVPAGLNIEAFRIYNRWGQKVFEASGANAGWDGKYKGEPQPADGYTYYIEVKFANGTIRKKTGSFTLLR